MKLSERFLQACWEFDSKLSAIVDEVDPLATDMVALGLAIKVAQEAFILFNLTLIDSEEFQNATSH